MGCVSSQPEPVSQVNASRHGRHASCTTAKSVKNDATPDFECADHYKAMSMLGEGGTGQTWLCRDRNTGKELAIKFMARPLPKVLLPMIFHEVKIQATLGEGHVNLVQARECILTKTHLGLAMEYVSGGNLTEYVSNKWESSPQRNGLFLAEDEARYFFKQFLSAVEYLHAHHVAHRDLKLDNIVLNQDDPPCVKLCDFGFAKNWEDQSNMFTQIGTPVYMSPQLINSKTTDKGYDAQKADVWACGVLLFVMMLGMFPFEHSNHPDPNSSQAHAEVWLQQIKSNWREAPRIAESAKKLSPECQDLLDQMFNLDEEKRISIPEIRAHPWYQLPMSQKHVQALDVLAESQARIKTNLIAGVYQSEARIKALQSLVDKAGNKGGLDEEVVRVPLAQTEGDQQQEGSLEAPSMKMIAEE